MREYDASGKPICSVCKKHKNNLSLEPSRSQLLFGGFHIKMEYRCVACETKVAKWVDKMSDNIQKSSQEWKDGKR